MEHSSDIPPRVIKRYLRVTLGRYASLFTTNVEVKELELLPTDEQALGVYSNSGVAAGVRVLFTDRALYQVAEGRATRIAYRDVIRTSPCETEKAAMASAMLTLHSGSVVKVWIDGGNPSRDVLQLVQFFKNLSAARLRGAQF